MAENGTTTTVLSDKQLRVLPYLVASPTVSEGARVSRVGLRTLYRWMNDADFRQELERRRSEAAELACVELKGLMFKAVHVLGQAMDDPSPHVRLRAAQTALSMGFRATELKEIERRLDILDDALPLWARTQAAWSGRS